MNNNIQKLMHKCYIENSQDQYDMEKFAELIVQECLAIMKQTANSRQYVYAGEDVPTAVHRRLIKEHFLKHSPE